VTYLLINGPSFLLHHHNYRIVSYEEANPCEKAVYYENQDGSCEHPVHISKSIEKCKLCETHTASPHQMQDFYELEVRPAHHIIPAVSVSSPVFSYKNPLKGRGPPQPFHL
jgi:hypothetical protein